MADDLITTTEAASILRLDSSAIRHRIRAGTLVAVKRGRDLYVSRKVIQVEVDTKRQAVFAANAVRALQKKRNGKKGGKK